MNNYLMEQLRGKKTYAEMVSFCADDMILNNELISFYCSVTDDMESFCGSEYDEETDTYKEIFQYYIINETSAERFAEYTNEIVFYLPTIDAYLLGVTHYGTSWSGVPANWKEFTE